ncbi:hypothetical protein [Novilysobacter erysipheiresistens]|uniref:Uncharacterized protein n=1 Tax=Novilysobacter erysipheiresistens TaxID=1749332 RepID=A0ABU7YUW5_9GAMM
MEAGISGFLISLLGAAVVGLVAWVWSLWRSHNDLKLKVAEEYVRTANLAEFRGEIHSLRDLVYRIALKMEVPVFTDHR